MPVISDARSGLPRSLTSPCCSATTPLFAVAGYTGITRGRDRNELYVVRGDDGDRQDSIRRALERSGAKQTAVEQRELGGV